MNNMVHTVDKLATMFAASEAAHNAFALPPSPVRRREAYQLAETEEEMSDNEIVSVMKLFSRDTASADAYLAFTRKSARSLWLRDALNSSL